MIGFTKVLFTRFDALDLRLNAKVGILFAVSITETASSILTVQ